MNQQIIYLFYLNLELICLLQQSDHFVMSLMDTEIDS